MVRRATLALGFWAVLSGCGLHGKPTVERKARRPDVPAAQTEVAEPDKIVSPGIVEPWYGEIELSAVEPGWIARMDVREGQVVEAGDLLAQLENASQRSAVALAQANVAAAEAAYTKTTHGATSEELAQANAAYEAAAAKGSLAQLEAARSEQLVKDHAVPDAEAQRRSAEAEAEAALAKSAAQRFAEVKRGPREEDREVARAQLMAARARLEDAEASVLRRQVVAPSKGTILLSRFHTGEFYSVGGQAIIVLGDMSRLQVRLEVDEVDAARVVVGAACTLYSDSGEELARGRVDRIAPKMGRRGLALESPTAREDVRVREVFIEVAPTTKLVPGQRVWGHTIRGDRV
jgi:multidrug resistance efflux pump